MLRRFGLRHAPWDHTVEQLPDEAQCIDLIIVLACGKGQQFGARIVAPATARTCPPLSGSTIAHFPASDNLSGSMNRPLDASAALQIST